MSMVRFEVFTVLTILKMFFWVWAPRELAGRSQSTRRPNPEHHQYVHGGLLGYVGEWIQTFRRNTPPHFSGPSAVLTYQEDHR
jgi:hypothetical protein